VRQDREPEEIGAGMTGRRAGQLGAAALLAALMTGCSTRFGAQAGTTNQGQDILHLWQLMVAIALVILALVLGLVVWVVVRYRRHGDDIPSQRQYVIPLEVVYTVVPLLILAVVFGYSWSTQDSVDALSKDPAVVVHVTGFQWQWQFAYPHDGITVTGLPQKRPELVLPVNRTARIVLTSRDVIHSMYIPQFLFKRDAIPGVVNRFDLTPTQEGRFLSRCAEFCGLNHAQMLFYVHVVSDRDFNRWIADHAKGSP
jgi:cytochrome c oxidase subunit II